MNWSNLWMKIFGTTTMGGVDMGFWVSMGISLIITIIMNVVFWATKPYKKVGAENKEEQQAKNN